MMRMMAGVALCVSTIKGSKVVVGAGPGALCTLEMVLLAAFVPHQLFVTVALLSMLERLLPLPLVVLPASRLKLMVNGPAPLLLPRKIPPPFPVAVLPVMVTLLKLVRKAQVAGQPVDSALL